MKIYGPYLRRDGRKHIVIVHDDGRKQTKSYPRLLLENKLGRELLTTETVDHVDGNYKNNSIDNLRILTRSENSAYGWITGNSKPHKVSQKVKDRLRKANSGYKNGYSKLSIQNIKDIRSRNNYYGLVRDLCIEFKVARRTIQNILKNKSYKNC